MDFTTAYFSETIRVTGFVVATLGVLWAFARAQWRRLLNRQDLNVYLLTVAAVLAMWSMRAVVPGGLSLHPLGAMLLVLMFDWPFAYLGLVAVHAAATIWHYGDWPSLGTNLVVTALLPVLAGRFVALAVARYLPRHFFVYVFVTAFFGASITVAVAGGASIALRVLSDWVVAGMPLAEHFLLFGLMGFAEAFTTGMLITLFVVYRPEWVITFRDSAYLR